MNEMKSLTLNDKKYDSFVDLTARELASASAVVKSASGEIITMSDGGINKLFGLRIFGKTTQDGTPTPDAPVALVNAGDNGSLSVMVAGKNLLRCSATSVSSQGVTFTVASDGIIDASGTATQNAYLLVGRVNLTPGKYFLNGDLTGSSSTHRLFITNGTREYNNYTADREFEVTEGGTWSVSILINAGTTVTGVKFRPMVRVAANADSIYEPYKAQVVTIATPNGLPGIPVSFDGNYTDANGQQWICDEIDLARGVYIKRIAKKVFDGTESGWRQQADKRLYLIVWSGVTGGWLENKCITSHFVCNADKAYAGVVGNFGIDNQGLCYFACDKATLADFKEWISINNVTVICLLMTPIEIPLSEEEIAAYNALRTYRDHTTVINDSGAWMGLEYVMDAKKYIDSMITGSMVPATVE